MRVADYGDTTNVLKLPLAPVAYLMGAMIVVAALVHLILIFVPHAVHTGVEPDPGRARMSEAFAGLAAMLVLSFLRVPIAFSMGLIGFFGVWWMRGLSISMASATTVVYESGFQYTLSVVPLFILMGNFVTRAGMSKELYRAAHTFVGHLRGGLAMATVIACAGFGAICGSSIATCGDDDPRRLSLDARPRLQRRPRRGLDRCRRHARHPDSAVDHHGDLRDHHRHQHRQAVRGRRAARPGGDRAALRRGAVHDLARPRCRAARRARAAGANGWPR